MQGNVIGLGSGTPGADLGNTLDGILVTTAGNTIGGTAGQGNAISGNNSDGIEIAGASAPAAVRPQSLDWYCPAFAPAPASEHSRGRK